MCFRCIILNINREETPWPLLGGFPSRCSVSPSPEGFGTASRRSPTEPFEVNPTRLEVGRTRHSTLSCTCFQQAVLHVRSRFVTSEITVFGCCFAKALQQKWTCAPQKGYLENDSSCGQKREAGAHMERLFSGFRVPT